VHQPTRLPETPARGDRAHVPVLRCHRASQEQRAFVRALARATCDEERRKCPCREDERCAGRGYRPASRWSARAPTAAASSPFGQPSGHMSTQAAARESAPKSGLRSAGSPTQRAPALVRRPAETGDLTRLRARRQRTAPDSGERASGETLGKPRRGGTTIAVQPVDPFGRCAGRSRPVGCPRGGRLLARRLMRRPCLPGRPPSATVEPLAREQAGGNCPVGSPSAARSAGALPDPLASKTHARAARSTSMRAITDPAAGFGHRARDAGSDAARIERSDCPG